MAEGFQLGDFGRPGDKEIDDDETPTPYVDIPPADATAIRNKEAALESLTGSSRVDARQGLLKTKVNAFLKVVADIDGLLPGPLVYDEFVLDDDCRTLYLKDGLTQVTWKTDSTKYRDLRSLGRPAEFIRTHLFPDYTSNQQARPTNNAAKIGDAACG